MYGAPARMEKSYITTEAQRCSSLLRKQCLNGRVQIIHNTSVISNSYIYLQAVHLLDIFALECH